MLGNNYYNLGDIAEIYIDFRKDSTSNRMGVPSAYLWLHG